MRQLLPIILLSMAACGAQEPGVSGNTNPDGPDAGHDVQEPDGPVELSIGVPKAQTPYSTTPLLGKGPKNGSILIEGPKGSVPAEVASDGTFCANVPLRPGENTLTVQAINEIGKRSETKTLTILQSGEPPKPGEAQPSDNAGVGALVVAGSMEEEEGMVASLADGKLNTSVLYQNAVWDDDWFTLRLAAKASVEKIRIYSNKECNLRGYYVHTATSAVPDMAEPGLEAKDSGPWTFRGQYAVDGLFNEVVTVNVTDCSTADLSCQEIGFFKSDGSTYAPEAIGAIGIQIYKDGCLSPYSGLGQHQIHEIEAWTPEGIAPPAPPVPSCPTIGG